MIGLDVVCIGRMLDAEHHRKRQRRLPGLAALQIGEATIARRGGRRVRFCWTRGGGVELLGTVGVLVCHRGAQQPAC